MPLPETPGAVPEQALSAALAAVSRRLRALFLLRVTSLAAVVAAVTTLMAMMAGARRESGIVVSLAVAAGLTAVWMIRARPRWSRSAAAAAVERATPESRNLVVTAEELMREPGRAREWIRQRVLRDAAAVVRSLDPSGVVRLRRDGALMFAAVSVWMIVAAGLPDRLPHPVQRSAESTAVTPHATSGERVAVTATITPPAYLGAAPHVVRDPVRLEGIRGSLVRLDIAPGPAASLTKGRDATTGTWQVRFGAAPVAVRTAGESVIAEMVLEESGYLAIEEEGRGGSAAGRLIPVAVTLDAAPVVRIEVPGKDLLLPPGTLAPLRVAASATDDFGLRSMELRFTKVSGSGEQFEFEEGTIPLAITRGSRRAWNARATLALPDLALQPGDAVVYRVVARDGRDRDAGLGSSDTFFVEIAAPGEVTPAGVELPPDQDRYALSQQMIVLKIERLRAREPAMSRDALTEEVAGIAAEQRAVRANFIFLTGGHVEDEEEEAEHSHEIQEGRLENTARREIQWAIQYMTRTELELVALDTAAALPSARAAARALERAFGRNRYFLRTAPVRSRIDLSRRLSGELDTAADWRREPYDSTPDARDRASRHLVAELLDLATSFQSAAPLDATALTGLAEQALAVDPVGELWPETAQRLLRLRDAVRTGQPSSALSAQLNALLAPLLAESRTRAVPRTPDEGDHALRSAWTEEQRRR